MVQTLQQRLTNGFHQLRSGADLKARAARGGFWLGLGSGGENALRFARQSLLAKFFLERSDFGIMALVQAAVQCLEAFTQVGIKEAVIQNPKGGEQTYLNGAWWFSVARSAAVFLIAFLCAPLIARVYASVPVGMLRIAFLSILFNGAVSPRAYVALKEMNYKRWVIINHGGAVVGIITAFVLGASTRSVWSLAIGFTVESASRCLLSYLIFPFRPGFVFDSESLAALFRYVRGIFGLPLMTFLYTRIDIFVLGKYATVEELGMYSMAFAFVQMPYTLSDAVVSPILMSAFSSVQNDDLRLATGILRSSEFLATLFLPMLTIMMLVAPKLLTFFYRPEYAEVTSAFRILCVVFSLRIIGWGLPTMYFATGRPELNRNASLIRLLVMLASIFPLVVLASRLNIDPTSGAAIASLISVIAWTAYNMIFMRKTSNVSARSYLASLSTGAVISAFIAGLWLILAHL